MFSSGMAFLKSQSGAQAAQGGLDEQNVVQAHQQAYAQGNTGNMDSQSIGTAAALEALKKFTGTGASSQNQAMTSGGQSKLIALAMSEASKLFDQSGGAASGNKQDAVNSAGAMIMKFMLKSQMSGMMGESLLTNLHKVFIFARLWWRRRRQLGWHGKPPWSCIQVGVSSIIPISNRLSTPRFM